VLDPERIRAVETGACPHTAIRDDVTANLLAVEDLEADFAPLDVVLVESGGDNLTATFSPALVDAQVFVLDVAGGGDVARKGGPGIGRADLLVVNKTDLGPYVGVDVPQMVADGRAARAGRPVIGLSRLDRASIDELTGWVRGVLSNFRSGSHVAVDPGPMASHSHADEGGTARVHVHAGGDAPHAHAGSGDGPHAHARVSGAALAHAGGSNAAHVHQPDDGRGGTAVPKMHAHEEGSTDHLPA
jgi:urease accessory protein